MKSDVFSAKELHKAYIDCRKRKRNTINSLKFEIDQGENLQKLEKELNSGTYHPARSVCFVIKQPKPREIFAADFYDRVVHHLLIKKIEPLWERQFIHDSYACRKKKGTHGAVDRLSHFVKSITKNGKDRAYFLQFDIENFFMTIHKNRLFDLIDKGMMKQFGIPKKTLPFYASGYEAYLAWRELAKTIVFHDPTKNYIRKGSDEEWKVIPKQKSLFNCDYGVGIPIGNLTSQFFANIYLNELDQFVKHKLKIKYYVRYVDDAVILHKDRQLLENIYEQIESFVKEKLSLKLKKRAKMLKPVSCGINFLGYIVYQNHKLTRKRVVNNFEKKLKVFQNKIENADTEEGLELIDKFEQIMNSYSAHMQKSNSYNLRKRIYKRNRWVDNYL